MNAAYNRKVIISFRDQEVAWNQSEDGAMTLYTKDSDKSFLRIKLILARGQDEVSLVLLHRRQKFEATIGYRSSRSLYDGHYIARDGWYYGKGSRRLAIKAIACLRHAEDIVQNQRLWEILQLYFMEVYKNAQA